MATRYIEDDQCLENEGPDVAPEILYVGRREAIIAEVGGLSHIYAGKYLAAPCGDANFDCSGADTKPELRAIIAEFRAAYPGIKVCWVS